MFKRITFSLILVILLIVNTACGRQISKTRVLLVDGQNNHTVWPKSTMMMKAYLEETGIFEVEIARTRLTWRGAKWSSEFPLDDGLEYFEVPQPKSDPYFKPDFSKYDVVVSNFGHRAAPWPEETQAALEKFVGVSVRLADDTESLEAVSNILAEGYPLPLAASEFFMRGIHFAGEADHGRLANVIATFEGQPAACASVCVRDGVAGVYCVATLEKFRGRGLGTAVTRAAMKQGQILGATHALLHASEMGAPIYTKIGFSEKCRIPVYGFGL